MIFQFKPMEESFYDLAYRRFRKLDCIVLGEGQDDAETFKAYLNRVGKSVDFDLGVSDCGGIDHLYELTKSISALARVTRKIKVIGIIVDAEASPIESRVKSILDSLGSEFKLDSLKGICCNTYEARIFLDDRFVWLVVSVNGVESLPFKKRMLEDHGVQIMLFEDRISLDELNEYSSAKELIRGDDILKLVMESDDKYVKEAFCHFDCLINAIGSKV